MAYTLYGSRVGVNTAASFAADAVVFDGTNDYLERGTLTGINNSPEATVSFWVYFDTALPATWKSFLNLFIGGTSHLAVFWHLTQNCLTIAGINSTGSGIVHTSGDYVYSTNTWYHVNISFKLDAGGGPKVDYYINDASVPLTHNLPLVNDSVNYTGTTSRIMRGEGANATAVTQGTIAEMYFSTEYIDLSIEANRRNFISATGQPVFLGTDGSLPTGTAPLVYMKGNADNWNAGTNYGSGGDFTMTGSVTDSNNEPVEIV